MMLNEGKSVSEISEVARIDSAVVFQLIGLLVKEQYARQDSNGYNLTFPVITLAEAQATRELVESVSDTLTAKITQNMPAYRSIIDSLVAGRR
jgi:DNA-binding IclR family transcriptional regulator